jgi:hypothetical protein
MGESEKKKGENLKNQRLGQLHSWRRRCFKLAPGGLLVCDALTLDVPRASARMRVPGVEISG